MKFELLSNQELLVIKWGGDQQQLRGEMEWQEQKNRPDILLEANKDV